MESSSTARRRDGTGCCVYRRSSTCAERPVHAATCPARAHPGSPPGISGHFSIFLPGACSLYRSSGPFIIASSPDVSPTSDRVRPDCPRALYILPGLRPLPSPTQDGPAQSLPWCGHKVSCCSWAPWLTFSAPTLRLERPGRMPAGSSPPLQGSGQSLVRVLAEFPANPWSDGLRSPVGKPQCVGQYSIDCPHPLIGQCRLVSE